MDVILSIFEPIHLEGASAMIEVALALFCILLLAAEGCYRLSAWAARRRPPSAGMLASTGLVTGGMLALFAFLLGVMFSMASGRYELRRQSVLDEANAIGTAWLRTQIVGATEATEIRRMLRDYIDVRIAAIQAFRSEEDEQRIVARTAALQTEIWANMQRIAERPPTPLTATLVVALNEMFDLATTNRRNFRHGVPQYVLRLVVMVAVLSVGAIGVQFGMNGHRQLIVTTLLLATWTLAVTLVIDIDSPRQGSVRIDPAPLEWTRAAWGPGP